MSDNYDYVAEIMGGALADAVRRAVAEERARCAAVCREVAALYASTGSDAAIRCAVAIERGAAPIAAAVDRG